MTVRLQELDIDHIVPSARGGRAVPNNYALAHASGNRRIGRIGPEGCAGVSQVQTGKEPRLLHQVSVVLIWGISMDITAAA